VKSRKWKVESRNGAAGEICRGITSCRLRRRQEVPQLLSGSMEVKHCPKVHRMTADQDRFAVRNDQVKYLPKIRDFGLQLQGGRSGVSLADVTAKINKLDFSVQRNDRILLLNLLRRRLARGNTLPVPRPLFTVKAINSRSAMTALVSSVCSVVSG